MADKRKDGKLVKVKTTVTTLPYTPTGYVETEAEKRLRAQGKVMEFGRRNYADGRVKFFVPGLEPDTEETLIAAGLLRRVKHPDGSISDMFLEPRNLRLMAWAMGMNEHTKKKGLGEYFPDLLTKIGVVAPGTDTLQ